MLDKVGQQNGHPHQTNKIDSLCTRLLKYYVNPVGWVQKIAIFAYYQYIEGGWVGQKKSRNLLT